MPVSGTPSRGFGIGKKLAVTFAEELEPGGR
jgi:hypothetical protein